MKQYFTLFILSFLVIPHLQAQLPSYVPSTGLVAWYPFNNNAQDQSGNNNHGTDYYTTLTTDRDGNPNAAYSFNGSNSYIDCYNITAVNNSPQLTLSAWFYSLGNQSGGRVISKEHYQNNAQGFHIGYSTSSGDNLEVMMSTNVNGGGVNSTVPINTMEWYHVALVFNGQGATELEQLKLYINGVDVPLSYNFPIPGVTSSEVYPLYIGNNYGYTSISQWYGKLDDVGIWNVALSAQQISDLYEAVDMTVGVTDAGQNNPVLIHDAMADLIRCNTAMSGKNLVRIYDELGALVQQQVFAQIIDISSLPQGIYVLQLTGSEFQQTFKFVKA